MIYSIIIPAYNEEKRIKKTLKDYTEWIKKQKNIELIVVCDGCNDKTAEIARQFKKIKVLEYPKRLGKGGGVFAGFRKAKGDYIGFVDSDNAIVPEEFEKIVNVVLKGYDCAIASRRIPGSRIVEEGNHLKRIGSNAINIIARVIFGIDVHDSQCGAKLFKKEVIEKIMPKIKSKGFEFDVELLWRIKNEGYSIKEVPITWYAKDCSKFSLLESPKMLANLVLRRMGL